MPQCLCCKKVGSPAAVPDRRFPAQRRTGPGYDAQPPRYLCDGCYYAPGNKISDCTHDGTAPA